MASAGRAASRTAISATIAVTTLTTLSSASENSAIEPVALGGIALQRQHQDTDHEAAIGDAHRQI